MGPPTVAQRIDAIEEKIVSMEESLKNIVTKAVEKAMEAMRHSLTEVVMEGQTLASKKMGADFEALTGRLEGRLNRSREYHETLINTMRSDQLKFQAEMKSTVTGVQLKQDRQQDKAESSVNRAELLFTSPKSTLGGEVIDGQGFDNRGFGGRDWGGGNSDAGGGFGQSGGHSNWKYRKLDMPVFDGTDPDGWILRVERYFGFYRLTEDEMLEAVVVAMEGDALRWYQWENKRHPIRCWSDLKVFIL